jgi:hypothetical protein
MLNWRLLHCRMAVLDYVVVHELSHLRVMDHSPRFWATVAEASPTMRPCGPNCASTLRRCGPERRRQVAGKRRPCKWVAPMSGGVPGNSGGGSRALFAWVGAGNWLKPA